MFWNKLSSQEKIGLSIAIGFFAVACFDRLLIHPIQTRFKKINQQIKVSEKEIGSDLRNLKRRDLVEAQYQKYLEYIQRSGSDEEEVAKILGEIESLARQSNVYVEDMKPLKPKEIDFYKEYAVEIEAEAKMQSLTNFLYQLNMSSQLLRVEKLRLNLSKGGSDTLKISMLVTKVLVL